MRELISWVVLDIREWSLFQYLCLGLGMAVIYLLWKVASFAAVSALYLQHIKSMSAVVADYAGSIKVNSDDVLDSVSRIDSAVEEIEKYFEKKKI